jgi:multiple sugar transport system permease protein
MFETKKDVWFYLGRATAYFLLTFFALVMLFPFLYMMFTSFKTSGDVFRFPPRLLPYSAVTTEVNGESVTVFEFSIDGRIVEMINTGERERYGFFTSEELVNVDQPRQSQTIAEVPLDQAVETGDVVTLTDSSGGEDEFDVYEVTVDGQTQRLLLAYRGAKDRFIGLDDPSQEAFAVAGTATPKEVVDFQINNYDVVFNLQGLNRALVNTSLVTLMVVAGQLVTSIFGGYAFSRVQFRGRNSLFVVYLGSIMIPFVVLIIPMYRLMVLLSWQDRIVSLIVPWIFSAYGTFLIRQFFITIPKDLEEAALLDGASRMRILWQIFVPLSKPAIATLAIFSFLYAWNSFLWPLIIINTGNQPNHVLTLALVTLSNIAADRPNLVLTGAAVAILPPVIIFIMAQKYFIQGVATSGVKG